MTLNWNNMSHLRVDKSRRIKEREYILLINSEYARAKRLLKPMLNGLNRSFVKFYWGGKPDRNARVSGTCAYKAIILHVNYRDMPNNLNWNSKDLLDTIRHELCHLAIQHQRRSVSYDSPSYARLTKERSHGGLFNSLMKILKQ